MSRVGLKPIAVPQGVEAEFSNRAVTVKGPKGSLRLEITGVINVDVDREKRLIYVRREGDQRADRAKHGLYRALIANMIEGVTKGFEKRLEVQGVGFRVEKQGNLLRLFVGYNMLTPERFQIPDGVKVDVPSPTEIVISGIDKQFVGQVASMIRSIRPPDVYKGKGIRYRGEVVRKLPGKTVGAAAGS
jgi:large subunit ribosomal protein L6